MTISFCRYMNHLLVFVSAFFLLSCCSGEGKAPSQRKTSLTKKYKDIFGYQYLALGAFCPNNQDSVEINLWSFSEIDHPTVFYGGYAQGFPTGTWHFVMRDGMDLTSQWKKYSNALTECSFSLPFGFKEITIDSSLFKLAVQNDSLGRISIIVSVNDTTIEDKDLINYGPNAEIGLKDQGYSFTVNRRNFSQRGSKYFFGEYFMRDSLNKPVKLYNIYGYIPSKRYFVDFTFFNDGEKDELAKALYSIIISSVYIGNERFFNPYLDF